MAAIGLGANLPSAAGAPAETLAAAMGRLGELGRVTARSSFYRTTPVGFIDQPEFVNAAVLLKTELEPLPLLAALLEIERGFGRDRAGGPPKGPRMLDLDLLLYDDRILEGPALTLPHPAMQDRRFVLTPLAEIAGGWLHPRLRRSVAEMLAKLPPDMEGGVRIVSSFP